MKSNRIKPLFWLLPALMLTVSLPALAQAPSIGVLDEDQLAEGYTKYREAALALDKQAKELDTQLDARELLNEAEGRRFDELIVKEKRAEAEETEFQNLLKAGAGRRAENAGLIGKATRSDAESARLKALNDQAQANGPAVDAIENRLFDAMKKRQQSLEDDYTNRANQVIQQVAEDKKLALVWRKRAIIWNAPATDITNEILARLNK
ncbi:MAG: hypothetical protein JWN98_2561 [Abditibacteriota bacterium]|nr:hypothetical protein [Abditibacteriota bacterium]